MGIFSFGKKGEASSERSSGRSRTSRGAERRGMDGDGARSPAAARTRRSSAVGQEAMLDPTLPEKQRARRRLVGAIALVMAAVIILPMVLDSHPKPVTGDIAISIPNSDQSDDAAPANGGDHVAANGNGNGAAMTAQAGGADRHTADGQDDDGDPAGAAAPDSPPPGAAGTGAAANVSANAAPAPVSQPPAAKPPTDIAKSRSSATAAGAQAKTAKPNAADAGDAAHGVDTHAKASSRADAAKPAAAQPDASADPLGEEIARRSAAANTANTAHTANASLPPTPATPGSRYVVQLGQFSGDSAARDWVGKLKNIGVPAYIEHQKQADGSTRVMLRAGPFADRSTAQAAVLKVRQAGLSSAGR